MTCPFCLSKKTIFFASKDVHEFNRCLTCKSLFIRKLPSKKSLNKYYERQFLHADGLINESILRTRSKQILKKLKIKYPFAKTICDVGSGCGFFIDEANKLGFKVLGIEPSKQLTHTATANYKVSQFIGSLETYLKKHNKQFDVVTCIHVIEHVTQPRKFIRSLLQLVNEEGVLFLETPNADSHLINVEKDKYTFLIPPEHLWILSKDAIEKLLPKNSQIIAISTYSYSEHFMGIMKSIIKKLSLRTKPTHENEILTKPLNHIILSKNIWKNLSYLIFDKLLAPLFTGLLNLDHKGSILELYINKKRPNCGL